MRWRRCEDVVNKIVNKTRAVINQAWSIEDSRWSFYVAHKTFNDKNAFAVGSMARDYITLTDDEACEIESGEAFRGQRLIIWLTNHLWLEVDLNCCTNLSRQWTGATSNSRFSPRSRLKADKSHDSRCRPLQNLFIKLIRFALIHFTLINDSARGFSSLGFLLHVAELCRLRASRGN